MDDIQKSKDWKTILKQIDNICDRLCDYRYIGTSLKETKAMLSDFKQDALGSRLEEIMDDFRLMTDFFQKGYQDNKREELYEGLVCKLYRLLRDIQLAYRKVYDSAVISHLNLANSISFDIESIRHNLESFVSEIAFCSLEADDVKQEKVKTIYAGHHQYMQQLFAAILFSSQWNHDFAKNMAKIIVSPTIDSGDAQLLVSGIMLADMFNRDPERLMALIQIYEQSQDVQVRQRALVGWTFAIDDKMVDLFDGVGSRLSSLLDDERVRKEIQELQMQVVYCRNAKRDNDKLQQDIMPALLKNQNFEITGSGIKPKEVDPLEEILHPEADEKKMEELENTMRKMMDMRDQGVDIYFGGFSQMKRFSFFYTLCNWFMPFSVNHPQLQHLSADFLHSGMTKAILKSSSFCDSDKYSFVLGTSAVYHNLPANIKEMLNSGEAAPGIYGDQGIDVHTPLYNRRMYLQDLYRFFTLSDSRHIFHNPFDDEHFMLLSHGVFISKMNVEARKVQQFLLKQKMYPTLSELYFEYKDPDNATDLKMEAKIFMHEHKYHQAQMVYQTLCQMLPLDDKILAGYAQASLLAEDYSEAADAYETLYEHHPENQNIAQYYAISLIQHRKSEEGVKILYRLEYENPDDLNIKRALAWGLLHVGRNEQAENLYQIILSSDSVNASDYLNAGYCNWFSGNISTAVSLMKKSFIDNPGRAYGYEDVLIQLQKDINQLQRHSINDVEIRLITDMIFA